MELERTTFEALVSQGQIVGPQKQISGLNETANELLSRASEQDFQVANQRYQVVVAAQQGQPLPDGAPHERTCRRWVRKYRQAEEQYGCGYVGLLPQTWRRGNRQAKLPEQTRQLMADFIEQRYETLIMSTNAMAPAISLCFLPRWKPGDTSKSLIVGQ